MEEMEEEMENWTKTLYQKIQPKCFILPKSPLISWQHTLLKFTESSLTRISMNDIFP